MQAKFHAGEKSSMNTYFLPSFLQVNRLHSVHFPYHPRPSEYHSNLCVCKLQRAKNICLWGKSYKKLHHLYFNADLYTGLSFHRIPEPRFNTSSWGRKYIKGKINLHQNQERNKNWESYVETPVTEGFMISRKEEAFSYTKLLKKQK